MRLGFETLRIHCSTIVMPKNVKRTFVWTFAAAAFTHGSMKPPGRYPWIPHGLGAQYTFDWQCPVYKNQKDRSVSYCDRLKGSPAVLFSAWPELGALSQPQTRSDHLCPDLLGSCVRTRCNRRGFELQIISVTVSSPLGVWQTRHFYVPGNLLHMP